MAENLKPWATKRQPAGQPQPGQPPTGQPATQSQTGQPPTGQPQVGGPPPPPPGRQESKSWIGFRGYDKVTEEYDQNKKLTKTTKERQIRKTFWYWLQLLIIPLVLAAGAIGFSIKQNNDSLNLNNTQYTQSLNIAATRYVEDKKSALDQQQATTLQTYIDNIQDLLLNHNLLKSKLTDDVAILARARTLTALKGLDSERKGRLLIFLHEAQLIGFCEGCKADSTMPIQHVAIIDLRGADLSNAALNDTDLIGADLSNTNLYSALLYRTKLRYATLTGADLRYANLQGADLHHADFRGVDLMSGADLSCTKPDSKNIVCADLSGAQGLTQTLLDRVFSCKGAKNLPPGLTCRHNQ